MYSTPRWALTFAAHCRSRLRIIEQPATSLPPPGIRTCGRRRRALLAQRGQVAWHTAPWAERCQHGAA